MTSKKKQKQTQQSSLPLQYQFVAKTPAPPPVPNRPSAPGVSDYPPPRHLFQESQAQPQATSVPLPQPSPPPQPRRSETSETRKAPSSNTQDTVSTEDPEVEEPSLSDAQLRALNILLSQPNRGLDIPILSPNFEPGTIWFGRDKGKLTRRITKVFTNKFDKAYYSWSVVPQPKKERLFIEFAKTHTWDQIHTGIVQLKFERVCQRRLKDMVSVCRRCRKQPTWIHNTLWEEMTAFWDTHQAKSKSEKASACRRSDRKGLGPHKHNSGQKSFEQIEQEMVEELGRPVSLGEVFIKTHTKKDGTFVDLKAQKVAEAYHKNKEGKMTVLEENSQISDTGSNDPQLSLDDDNELFLLSTFTNERGEHYGIGSLQQTVVNGKRKFSECSSSAFLDLKKQLQAAHRKIEEQAASNALQAACIAEQANQISELSLVGKFLAETDPRYKDFIAANSTTS